jgi:hypothetical protein
MMGVRFSLPALDLLFSKFASQRKYFAKNVLMEYYKIYSSLLGRKGDMAKW